MTVAVAHSDLDLGVGRLTALSARPEARSRGVVLLVPGFTGSKEDFGGFLPLLAARGWEAWSYSQRGQADSAAPPGVENYTLALFASDVVAVAEQIGAGRPVHLLGHSFGGVVARAAAILSPGSFSDLTMLCSGPHGWAGRLEREATAIRSRGSAAWWNEDNPHTVGRPDAELIGGGIDVLVAHGAADLAWPQEWQAAMAFLLDGAYEIIPDAAHSPQLENPAATASVLDAFWSRGAVRAATRRPVRATQP